LRSLTQTDAENYFKRAEKFFSKARTAAFYQELEESLPIYTVARDIAENHKSISKVQFYLLSNASLSSRFKGVKTREIDGYKTVYDIWDISRLTRINESGKAKEDIIIDFREFVESGIPCLPAFTTSSICSSYLLAMPGEILASMYDRYGERLLEQNVRTFLQFRGGVNKGIRNTLQNQPEMFFAYNNGLTVTAEAVDFYDNHLYSAKNLQIVNGGQTTASIFMAKRLDAKGIDLNKVYIQVKLSVIEPNRIDDIVPVISKCANTQNKVSDADFFSNHPFHKRIEEISRRILAPSSEGDLTETHWFYERTRGQYANQQVKMTTAQQKKFLIQNPKNQMFNKTDLAKFENTFALLPHFVSKGAQWNFGKFAEIIGGKGDNNKGLWETNDLQFNELYFKHLIAKAIMFRFLDSNVMKQSWYGGYKANIVVYTLSIFSYLVAENAKVIDFQSIWQKQKLSTALQTQLLELSEIVNKCITDTNLNVTQYCKQEICWHSIRDYKGFQLNDDVLKELVDIDLISDQIKDSIKEQKIDKGIAIETYVFNKGGHYWFSILEWSKGKKILNEKEISLLTIASKIPKLLPTEKQCKLIADIEKHAASEGFSHE
jgi:hypothetical protein